MQLTLYGTLCCHLCEKAEVLILAAIKDEPIIFEKIDIAENDALLEMYGLLIPVLLSTKANRQLTWPFNLDDIKGLL